MHLLPIKQKGNSRFRRHGSVNYSNRKKKGDKELPYQYVSFKMAKCLLSTVGEWDFNIFNLDQLTNGRALFHMSLHLFQEHGLIEEFNLDIVKLMKCISLIEEGYHSNNPYHNAVHAADVVQAMHCFLKEKVLSRCITPLEVMIGLIAAITHDIDHPGVNQGFLIATSNHLAHLYKNNSVLENHHWRSAVGIIYESGVFEHFDADTWNAVEMQLKSLILATDITRQHEFLSKFRDHLNKKDLNMRSHDDRHFLLQIALKCADICNPCRPWKISRQWSYHVCDEFFKQGDNERKLELAVTPMCDRSGTSVAKIQVGFMQFVVLPLFQEWYRFNSTDMSQQMLKNTEFNKTCWNDILNEQDKKAKSEADSMVLETKRTETPREENKENVIKIRKGSLDARQELQTVDENTPDQGFQLQRRHSLPPAFIPKEVSWIFPGGRDNYKGLDASYIRRHSLPVSSVLKSTSYEKLQHFSEKLSSLAEHSPSNGSRVISIEALQSEHCTDDKYALIHQTMASSQLSRLAQPGFNNASRQTTTESSGGTRNPVAECRVLGRGYPLQPLSSNPKVSSFSYTSEQQHLLEDEELLDSDSLLFQTRSFLLDRPRSLSLFNPESQPLLPKDQRKTSLTGLSNEQMEEEGEEISHMSISLQDHLTTMSCIGEDFLTTRSLQDH